jgi:hypothetical protein
LCSPVKYTKDDIKDEAPAGPNWACQPGGGIQTDTFNKWFDYFVHLLKVSAQDPVLLTADGHIKTTKKKDVTRKATEHGVDIINLPTHSTQKKIQPLDVGFMASFRTHTYYVQETETWLGRNPGRVVNPFIV